MSKNFIIPLVIYPFDVMVSLGETDEELKSSLKKVNTEWDDNMACVGKGRFYMTEQKQSIIRLSVYPKTNEDYGTLAHEIFHAVTHILNVVGMKLAFFKSDEAYAYLMGYLTTEIYKKI